MYSTLEEATTFETVHTSLTVKLWVSDVNPVLDEEEPLNMKKNSTS